MPDNPTPRAIARRNLREIMAETLRVMAPQPPAVKSISGYVQDYTAALTGLAADVINGDSDWATMARKHRALLQEYAGPTYREGMWESGEYSSRSEALDNFESDDEQTVGDWIAEQRGYVAEFAKAAQAAAKLFAADDPGAGAAQDAVFARADMWADSLRSLGDLGKASAKANQPLTWRLGATEKHCETCATLNGQTHRLKWYTARDYIPRKNGAAMECGGWRCECGLYNKAGEQIM